MTLLDEAMREKEFDIRMIERGINKGSLTRSAVEKNIKALQDESAHAETQNIEQLLEEVKISNNMQGRLHN